MVNDDRHGIIGLTLPDDSNVRIQSFADDTALFLRGSPHNLQRAFGVLEKFCEASGAKLNWDKSYAIWAPDKERDWSWGEELGLRWLRNSEVARYLGFPFGKRVSQKDKDARSCFKFDRN